MNLTEADFIVAPELRGVNVDNVQNVLNNFMFNFPTVESKRDDGTLRPAKSSFYKRSIQDFGSWTRKNKESKGWVTSGNNGYVYSELKGNQTPEEFFAEIDKTIAEADFTTEQVAVAGTEFWVGERTPESFERFAPVLIAVYIRLRQKGYTRRDLTA